MNTILALLRLIRFPNLVIIALTMLLMRYGVLQPILVVNGLSIEMGENLFMMLVTAVVLIAAAGYMVNDYMDVETDKINKPDKVLIGRVFRTNAVFNAYIALNVVAMGLAFYVTYQVRFYSLFLLFPLATGALWFYSDTYKRQFLIGNILVSLLTALVPLIPAFFEVPFVIIKYKSYLLSEGLNLKYLYAWTGVFALFAFITNLIREIVKDAEDYAGDELTGCITVPVMLGERVTRIIIVSLSVILIAILAFVYTYFLWFNLQGNIDYVTMLYLALLLLAPLFVVIYNTIKIDGKKGFSRSSQLLKLVMVFGILYALVLRFKVI